jgi:saccharopine dehydrogenase (NAD+, L-lysine-forming)
MSRVLIIGAGGVGRVVSHKCVQQHDFFESVCLASRTMEKCKSIQESLGGAIDITTVDAASVSQVAELIRRQRADIVIHAALPYQNLAIMEGCLSGGAHYIDTAVPEIADAIQSAPDDDCWYGKQWAFHNRFRKKGLTGVLGIGSDPGLVNVFCAYAATHLFDEIHTIDIMDVNDGRHDYSFATNFSPEINLREVQCPARHWERGQWRQSDPLTVRLEYDFPAIGQRSLFLMDHDELHSLSKHFQQARHIKFWMGFSPQYISYFRTLQSLGLLAVEPRDTISIDGTEARVVPLRFLAKLLPDQERLGACYEGEVCIGCLISGMRAGREKRVFIYSLFDHQTSYQETGVQAISYAGGVPPVAAALLMTGGQWLQPGVYNAEHFDPLPFLGLLPKLGITWHMQDR